MLSIYAEIAPGKSRVAGSLGTQTLVSEFVRAGVSMTSLVWDSIRLDDHPIQPIDFRVIRMGT